MSCPKIEPSRRAGGVRSPRHGSNQRVGESVRGRGLRGRDRRRRARRCAGRPVTGAAPPYAVTGACHVSPIVDDLDRSARFYHDLIGLDLVPTPSPGPLPWDEDPGHLHLHGMPQARLRFIGARMPGIRCGVELVEMKGIDRKPVRRRIQDPGAVTLILLVRDLDAAFAKLKAAGVPVVSTGGAPVSMSAHQPDAGDHRPGSRRPLRGAGPARSAARDIRAGVEQRHRHPAARHRRATWTARWRSTSSGSDSRAICAPSRRARRCRRCWGCATSSTAWPRCACRTRRCCWSSWS